MGAQLITVLICMLSGKCLSALRCFGMKLYLLPRYSIMKFDIDIKLNLVMRFYRFTGRFNATGSILNRENPGLLMLRTPFPSYGNGKIRATVANTTGELRHFCQTDGTFDVILNGLVIFFFKLLILP